MAELKVTINGKDVLIKDVDIEDGFAVLNVGENQVKFPVEDWEEAAN